MPKTIRPTYQVEVSIGIVCLIFLVSAFLSFPIFHVELHQPDLKTKAYIGMVLIGLAVNTMVLIVWEEILFPIKIKERNGVMTYRNHRAKLLMQLAIYSIIPLIFTYIYLNYQVNKLHFFIWAGICLIPPVVEKLISGINNYNDFIRFSATHIAYKNNEKEGEYAIANIRNITLIEDEAAYVHKIQLTFLNGDHLTIDLDEMELEDFYTSIQKYIQEHYVHLLKSN